MPEPKTRLLPRWLRPPALWPLLGLVVLFALNAAFNPGFLKITVLNGHLFGMPVDILTQGSRTMLVALGMTLVIATGGIDLSVGSVVAISGAVCAQMLGAGHGLAFSLAAALTTGLAAGLINGVLVTKAGVQPIVATLILMVAGRGVAQLIAGGQVLIIASKPFAFIANGHVGGLPFAPVLVVGVFGLTWLLLRRTALALFIEAVGDNGVAARFAGLGSDRIKIFAYVFCGACAALTGVLVASDIRAADSFRAGENMELDAIFAVVLGGTALTGGRFFLLGTALGALLIQTLTTSMYNLGVAPAVAPVPKALLIIAVSLLQSDRVSGWLRGLVRRKEAA